MFGINTLPISAGKCNRYKHPWKQQVFSAVFKNTSPQHQAGAGRLSSPQQLPVMVISLIHFQTTHTHANLHLLQLTHFLICTLARIGALERSCSLFTPPSLFLRTQLPA